MLITSIWFVLSLIIKIMFFNIIIYFLIDFSRLKGGKNNNRNKCKKECNAFMYYNAPNALHVVGSERKIADSTIMLTSFPRTNFLYKCVTCKYLLFLLYDENSEPRSFRLNNEFSIFFFFSKIKDQYKIKKTLPLPLSHYYYQQLLLFRLYITNSN